MSDWDFKNKEHVVRMRCGDCWYLDTRKPHRAINDGDADRIHLVIDVESSSKLRNLMR